MPQIINTNIASINAQRNLDKSQSANQTALQRLSSGLRINSAKDDAAGLAISTRFTSQIKGLNVAVRNAGDGIALAQTAEGALGSINENLQRIRELSVQSANATNSDVDRDALQAEVDQLVAEISRTAEETDFNGRKLLDGSFSATFQVGANAGQTLDVSIAELTADKLGSSSQAGVSAQGTSEKLSNGDLVINGEGIRASVAGDDELSFTDKEKSAIAKVAAINDVADVTGVTATVDANVVVGADMDSAGDASAGTTITLNGVAIDIQGTDNSSEAAKAGTRGSVIAAINAKAEQTGVTASDGGKDGGVVLTAADGRNITIDGAANDLTAYGLADADTAANTAETSYAGFTLTAQNANTDIVISGGNDTGNGNIENSGLAAGTYSAQTAATSNTDETIANSSAAATPAGLTGANLATAVNGFDLGIEFVAATTYDTATLNTLLTDSGYTTQIDAAVTLTADIAENALSAVIAEKQATERGLQDGDLVLNDVGIGASSSLDDTASDTTAATSDAASSGIAIAAAINKSTEQTGVSAEVNSTEVVGGSAPAGMVAGDGTTALTDAAAGTTIALKINNVEVVLTETNDYEKNKANAIAAINEVSGQTGVVATDNGESLTLTAADGRNISLYAYGNQDYDNSGTDDTGIALAAVTTNIANFGLSSDSVGINESPVDTAAADEEFSYVLNAKTSYSTVTLSSAKAIDVGYGTNGAEGLDDSGFKAGVYGGGEDGQALTDIDITTFEGAQDALVAVDNAIAQVASQRADLGAVQNRMESTVSNLQITSENLNSANSRIQDADFAAETAELQRTNVLQQAGISVLAQANAAGQQVLSLLG